MSRYERARSPAPNRPTTPKSSRPGPIRTRNGSTTHHDPHTNHVEPSPSILMNDRG